ncbi:MAG: hypothetical protein JST80_01225 [Bdellovibrionales bacterium]|nr:hypothetical protein [Bdellovibrionales bacterium]
MKTKILLPFFALLLGTLSAPAHAFVSPIGVSVVPPIQFPPENFSVAGVRVNALWGQHYKVYGLDAGVVNVTLQNMAGFQVGAFNWNKGETFAFVQAGVGNTNINKTNIYGLQAGAIMNVNKAESFALGVVASLANMTNYMKVVGIEVGGYNKARTVYGFQIGIVNIAEDLVGLQIGLINFHTHGVFAMSPILNFGF